MMRYPFRKSLSLGVLLGVIALLGYATPGSAILGVRRRTAIVAYSMGEANARAQQSAAAQQQAPAQPAASQKTPQEKLEDLQSLYKQGLISESDYNAAKAKILAEMSQ